MLSIHPSFPEIAEGLFLSRHTVKSQASPSTGSWGPPHAVRPSPSRSGNSASSTVRSRHLSFHPAGKTPLLAALYTAANAMTVQSTVTGRSPEPMRMRSMVQDQAGQPRHGGDHFFTRRPALAGQGRTTAQDGEQRW
jgi:hypothetical protein